MKDAIKMMESNMPPESVRRAHIKAEQDTMTIRLAQEVQEIKEMHNDPKDASYTTQQVLLDYKLFELTGR